VFMAMTLFKSDELENLNNGLYQAITAWWQKWERGMLAENPKITINLR
jgi:hypothetical protein